MVGDLMPPLASRVWGVECIYDRICNLIPPICTRASALQKQIQPVTLCTFLCLLLELDGGDAPPLRVCFMLPLSLDHLLPERIRTLASAAGKAYLY